MSKLNTPFCPECEDGFDAFDRRNFIRAVGGGAAAIAAGAVAGTAAPALADSEPTARQPRPAEALVQELYRGLSAEQRQQAVHPWNHGARNGQLPTRMRMFNGAFGRNIGQIYSRQQQELVERILRSISNGEEGYRKITRGGTFDRSRSMQNCGAYIFGDPTTNQWAWVFMGHHLTVRCDGNSVPGAAFGGPIYYGHSPNGYSERNIFYYQTQAVRRVFDALNERQRRAAMLTTNPGEHERSVRFRGENDIPGLRASEMTRDQKQLVESVMRNILSPYRQADTDEVMQIIRQNGGLDHLRLGFYRDRGSNEATRWHFWRIEGPGFVWNYRVLPHVHTYVNISSQYQNS